jgi:dTDP-4-amino-4,6-dideoxygalactose transaminase
VARPDAIPPVHSPVALGAVLAGAGGALGGAAAAQARVRGLVLAEYGARAVLPVGSGTAALTLALLAARRRAEAAGRAPLAALPAYGCFDLATAAAGAGVEAIFYDVNPGTLGPDWASLASALAQGPAAVVAAHFYGVPVDVPRVVALADAAGALVIDDAAQGLGAVVGGRPAGALGHLGVLSFGRGKGRTGGGGGALLALDDAGAALLESVRDAVGAAGRGTGSLARLAAQWALGRPPLYRIPASIPQLGLGETRYHDPVPVTAMPAACAAALAAGWQRSREEVAVRRRVAAAWRASRATHGWQFPESDASASERGELRLAALVPEKGPAVVARLGLGAASAYPCILPVLPVFAGRAGSEGDWPGASRLVQHLITLPCHRYAEVP